ncbi:MAG: HPr family phosphocarrier protein [Acidobacteria bacterium]|nr:HPr family phosphocarrier protein [Acidobacteriota bacterium]
MLEGKIKVCNALGLHARAAAQLVNLAGGFKSKIKLRRTDNHGIADAKSILSVLTLAASKGVELKIEVEGKDESEAMQAIEEIFRNGFGET